MPLPLPSPPSRALRRRHQSQPTAATATAMTAALLLAWPAERDAATAGPRGRSSSAVRGAAEAAAAGGAPAAAAPAPELLRGPGRVCAVSAACRPLMHPARGLKGGRRGLQAIQGAGPRGRTAKRGQHHPHHLVIVAMMPSSAVAGDHRPRRGVGPSLVMHLEAASEIGCVQKGWSFNQETPGAQAQIKHRSSRRHGGQKLVKDALQAPRWPHTTARG